MTFLPLGIGSFEKKQFFVCIVLFSVVLDARILYLSLSTDSSRYLHARKLFHLKSE